MICGRVKNYLILFKQTNWFPLLSQKSEKERLNFCQNLRFKNSNFLLSSVENVFKAEPYFVLTENNAIWRLKTFQRWKKFFDQGVKRRFIKIV